MKRKQWFGTISGLVGVTMLLAPAEAAGQATAQPSTRSGDEDEIVVTARKREESLADIPAAGTAFNAQRLEQFSIETIEDLVRVIPSGVANGNGPETIRSVSIRGAGAGRSAESNSAVGLFKNGVFNAGGFFGGRSFTRADIFDAERVEVFRGPQGGLYGRNSVGGAINVVTARPDDGFSLTTAARAASFETYGGEFVLNAPLSPSWGARVGAFYEQSDGYIENVAIGGPEYGDTENYGGRLTLVGQIPGGFNSTLIFEVQHSESPGFSGVFGNIANPALGRDQRIANTPSNSIVDEYSGTLELTRAFGSVNFTSITVYRYREGDTIDDLDSFVCAFGDGNGWDIDPQGGRAAGANNCAQAGTTGIPANNVNAITPNGVQSRVGDFSRIAQEFRLDGVVGERFTWLLGVDYLVDADTQLRKDLGFAASANVPAGTDPDTASDLDSITDITQDTTSWSVFGSAELDFTDHITGALEVRWLNEERGATVVRTVTDSSCFVSAPPAANSPTRCQTPLNFMGEFEESLVLPVASLQFRPNEMGMAYVRVATGSRPGGFNHFAGGAFTYDAEKALSYEVGAHLDPYGSALSLNAAVYYTQLEDAQLTSRDVSSTGVVLSNIGDAEIMGFEADVRSRLDVGPGRLFINAGFAIAEGEFTSDLIVPFPGSCPVGNPYPLCPAAGPGARNLSFLPLSVKGLPVAQLPDLALNLGAVYSLPLGSSAELTLSANYSHREGGVEEVSPNLAPSDPAFSLIAGTSAFQLLDDYDVLDARAALEFGNVTLSVFGKNITDDRYILEQNNRGPSAKNIYAAPETFGVEIRVSY